MMITEEFEKKFLTNTDESGRFIVCSVRTGKRYFVEPIGDSHIQWGSINPGTKILMHKKGDGKYKGSIEENESLITEENGFTKITMLEKGVSPHHAIEVLDAKYPDKELS